MIRNIAIFRHIRDIQFFRDIRHNRDIRNTREGYGIYIRNRGYILGS